MTPRLQRLVKSRTLQQSGEILFHPVDVTAIINNTQGIECPKRVSIQYLVIKCIDLKDTRLSNGRVVTNGRLLFNTTEYRCNEGYELIGDNRRNCQQDETWTGAKPTCRSKQEGYSKILLNYLLYSSQNVQHSSSSKEWISLTSQLQ